MDIERIEYRSCPLVEIAAGGPFYFAPLEVNSSASSPAP
jgi:hypothetical protein